MITYNVWINKDGDTPKLYTTHISENIADKVAHTVGGYVQIKEDNLHPDYISQLIGEDNNLKILVL